jgi:hypothetical protein
VSIYFFFRKKFANRGFAELATVNSPNSFAGRGIAVVHIGEIKKGGVLTGKPEKKKFPWQKSNGFC